MFLKEEDKKVEKDLLFNSLSKSEINKVFQSNNSFKNGVFVVKHRKESFGGFVVSFSKKLKLNKPQKNKIKRQLS